MNYRQLKYFDEVYKLQSIREAAARLFISPQGLSKTILQMEDELGYKLFVRSEKRMIPTEDAHAFKAHADNIISEYELIMEGRFFDRGRRKRLKILYTYGVMDCLGTERIGRFIREHPEILPAFIEIPDSYIISRLGSGESQIAIVSDPVDLSLFDSVHIHTEKYVYIMRTDHILASRKTLCMADLDGQKLITKGSEFALYDQQMSSFARKHIFPDIVMEATDYRFAAEMATADNRYMALTLESLARKYIPEGTVAIPMDTAECKQLSLISRKGEVLTPEARAFRDHIIAGQDKK